MSDRQTDKQIARYLARDERDKQRVRAHSAALGFALDSAGIAEMSSQELACDVLKRLGLNIGGDSDAVEALDFYLIGRRHALQMRAGTKASAFDSVQSDNFIDRYIRGEKT